MRPYASALDRLRTVGLRPTRQRLALAKLLFDAGHRHVTAEELHKEARDADVGVSLATIYNTLHQFTEAGLLREVVVDSGRCYFDTNNTEHHHFFHQDGGHLIDIPASGITVENLPKPPDGTEVSRVEVIVRVAPTRK